MPRRMCRRAGGAGIPGRVRPGPHEPGGDRGRRQAPRRSRAHGGRLFPGAAPPHRDATVCALRAAEDVVQAADRSRAVPQPGRARDGARRGGVPLRAGPPRDPGHRVVRRYVTMFSTMDPALRARALRAMPGTGFDNEDRITAVFYMFDRCGSAPRRTDISSGPKMAPRSCSRCSRPGAQGTDQMPTLEEINQRGATACPATSASSSRSSKAARCVRSLPWRGT